MAIERVQTGIRVEKKLLKVLKGLAEYHDMSLGDLLEGICLHALEGKAPFTPKTLERAAQLRAVYSHEFTAADSHKLAETKRARSRTRDA
jgi:predicted DNA-binding ribbon-helix-helix protein